MSADWCFTNSLCVATSIRSDLVVWDTSRAGGPVYKKLMHEEGMRCVKFAQTSDSIIATSGQPNYSVKVTPLSSTP